MSLASRLLAADNGNMKTSKLVRPLALLLTASLLFFSATDLRAQSHESPQNPSSKPAPPAGEKQESKQKQVIDLVKLKHPDQPALWKIEGKGIDKPSYLFGTVHHGDPRVIKLHPIAEDAFNKSTHFYTELAQDPRQKMVAAMQLMRRDGKAVSESLGPELTKEVKEAILAIDPKYNVQQLQILKTWALSLMLPSVGAPNTAAHQFSKTLDMALHEKAVKANKKTGALESASSQSAVFDQFTEEEQILFVRSSVKSLRKRIEKRKEKTESEQLVHELYLANHLEEMAARTNNEIETEDFGNEELSKQLTKAMKEDRNVKMADKIEKALTKHSDGVHFFAVGVGHYIGEKSINEMLVKKGYTVTPLFKPLPKDVVIAGQGFVPDLGIAKPKKVEKKARVGENISEIRWGKQLAGTPLSKNNKVLQERLNGKVVLLVLWGS